MVYFEIQADEPKAAVEFYKAVFGWTFTLDEKLPIEYWRIDTGEGLGAILKRPAPVPAMGHGTNAFVCTFGVTDYDMTAKTILELGGIEAMPKMAVAGKGWQGYFVDTAGNTFGMFEADEKAQ